MNPIDKFRYMDAGDRRKLYMVGGLFVAAVLATSTLVVTRCNRAVDVSTGRLDTTEQAALAQVREAFFAVQTALVGEVPAHTVADAAKRVANEKGAATLKSVVDQSPLRFNPNKADWLSVPRGGAGGAATGTPLVVAPAPPEFKARNIVMIGVGRGGIPMEIAPGSEPAWLATAATAPD